MASGRSGLAGEDDTGSKPRRVSQFASGSGTATVGPIAQRTPEPGGSASPESIRAALPRVVAGLALVLFVLGLMTIPGGILTHLGDTSPNTFVFAAVWPWALVAALFVITCRDHPWASGAVLGLLAGTTGLLSGGDSYPWIPFGLAAAVLAVACLTTPWWLALAGGGLGAVGVFVVAYSAHDLTTINGDGEDITLVAIAVALTGLAVFRLRQDRHWLGAVAPALLLLDAVLMLTAEVPLYVTHASLAALIAVPLIVTLTSGTAGFAACLVVAAGLLVRANDYVSAGEPTFLSVSHVTLPVAAGIVAYFSRSR